MPSKICQDKLQWAAKEQTEDVKWCYQKQVTCALCDLFLQWLCILTLKIHWFNSFQSINHNNNNYYYNDNVQYINNINIYYYINKMIIIIIIIIIILLIIIIIIINLTVSKYTKYFNLSFFAGDH